MSKAEFVGCTLLVFGPIFSLFFWTVARDPLKIILFISAAFFWLVSLLLSSILWYAVIPLRQELAFGLVCSVLLQEAFRFAYYVLIRRAENGLQKFTDTGRSTNQAAARTTHNEARTTHNEAGATHNEASSTHNEAATTHNEAATAHDEGSGASQTLQINKSRYMIAFVCGQGFGAVSSAFSVINLLADISGPGSVGIHGWDSPLFPVVSSVFALIFYTCHITWTLLLYASMESDSRRYKCAGLATIVITHILASSMTLLNERQVYGASIPVCSLVCTLLVTLVTLVLYRTSQQQQEGTAPGTAANTRAVPT